MNKVRLNARQLTLLAAALSFAVIGGALLLKSHAATAFITAEPENGTLSNGATAVSDASASGGEYIQLNAAAGPMPVGVPGAWQMVFDDEFNGTSLDTSKWNTLDGWKMNNVTVHTSNVAVTGGSAILTLTSSSSGAEICSCNTSTNFLVQDGSYAEARVYFPGNGSSLHNWPAWWASGPNWPAAGENDIAEVLSGKMTVNYHSPSGSHNQGTIAGYWGDAYHVYGLYRNAGSSDVYYDGVKIKSYPTDDNHAGESLIVNIGEGGSSHVYGTASQVKVDYVRVWQ